MRRLAAQILPLLTVGLLAGGCTAAGLASGPLIGAIQLVAQRSVERTVPGTMDVALAAVEQALARSGITIGERALDGEAWKLRGEGENVTLHARLERVTSQLTKVVLRVERGGILPDRNTAEQLHSQIGIALAAFNGKQGDTPADKVATDAIGALKSELHQLKSVIEADRAPDRSARGAPSHASSAEPTPGVAINQNAIVTVPPSYGLPTQWQVPSQSTAVPTSAPTAVATAPVDASIGAEKTASVTASPLARGLRPAAALAPVQPMVADEARD